MTTKEKLIKLINSEESISAFLLNEDISYLADLIISKLPEWGWSYDKFSDTNHPIHQEPEDVCDENKSVCRTFAPDMSTTSATKCKCGKEKHQH